MKLLFLNLIIASFLLFTSAVSVPENKTSQHESYRVESIEMPEGLSSETGAIEFLPDGRLVACFHRGEVMIYNPQTKKWSLFAEGLHDPLGILVVNNNEIIVMHRPELTRIKDTDGDGQADLYENLTDDFGISGNFHEFNYGPVKDKNGNLFIALNTASPNGGVRKEVRGKLDSLTLDHARQMFSVVPYRGWILKLTQEGNLMPYASGFRSPNGLVFDAQGNLFATDNQGDWVGTSPLYHVQESKFYGHPASLVWKKDWQSGNPYKIPVADLDKMRTRASVLFPQGTMANSPSQPVFDNSQGKFGPFAGQMFVGEMNQERIVRVMLEKIDGQWQGACIPFIDGKGLRKGNNRLAFAPDGSLWVGQNDHGWPGDQGIQRIAFTGKSPLDVYTMQLTAKGFDLTFTQPLDVKSASNSANYKFSHYYYKYHPKYGSDQFDVQNIPVTDVRISKNRKRVSLTLQALKPGYIYELKLSEINGIEGEPLANKLICYTLNKLKK
jgi:glucose/arabinose dehydrogenase